MYGWTLAGYGNNKPVRGKLGQMGWASTAADGAAFSLGAASTKKDFYACIHAFKSSGASGASVKFEVHRSTSVAFTAASTVTTITLTTANVGAAQWNTVVIASSKTDYAYRVRVLQAGTSAKRLKTAVILAQG
jgi:hypothetical protein